MKNITRTIKVTTVLPATVLMEGDNVVPYALDPLVFYSKVTDKQMKAKVRQIYGDNVIILSVREEKRVYKMDIATFISNAKEI